MLTIPVLLATALILAIIAAWIAAYQYWDRHPEKAQAAAGVVLRPVWRAVRLSSRVVYWPVSLTISWATILVMAVIYTAAALAWALVAKVVGKPAKFTIQFA